MKRFLKKFLTVSIVVLSLTLAWDANSENDLAGYYMYRTATPGQYTLGGATSPNYLGTVSVMPNPQYVDTNVPEDTWYYVVTAFDNEIPSNESLKSNEVSITITPPITIPAAPTNLHHVPNP
ncbi:MAG: hypothetical protein ACXADW_23385 [Candidatus Hodarchaeales archaeon]|jgi:hypothetical protein